MDYEGLQRMIDFFIVFYLTIFLSLIPLYSYNDKTRESISIKRDIKDMSVNINNLPLKIYEVNLDKRSFYSSWYIH